MSSRTSLEKPAGAMTGGNTDGPQRLQALYAVMTLIRQVEQALSRLFADGDVPGFIHLSVGQEAVAAGVASALSGADTLATTHRGHGHVLARGIDVEGLFKEIMGKAGGLCQGRGGSMHVADLKLGILGANGIVGAGIPIAVGSAMAHAMQKSGAVAVVFFGDGAMAEGVLHESLNMAALWKLPLLFVCENNGWSEFSPTSQQFAGKLEALAGAFGITHELVDGNDALAVSVAARAAVGDLRAGRGPRVLECVTHRVRGHFEGDPQKYRNADEMTAAANLDPIARARASLLELGAGAADVDALDERAGAMVDAAIAAARADGLPSFANAVQDVYTQQERT